MKEKILGPLRGDLPGILWVAFFFALFMHGLTNRFVPFLLLFIPLLAATALCAVLIRLWNAWALPVEWSRRTDAFFRRHVPDRLLFLVSFCLILICWMPTYLACYPGTYGYDVPIQVAQFFHIYEIKLTSHHPLVHTLLICAFLKLGGGVFHDYTLGYAMFTFFQMTLAALCAARTISFIRRKGCPALLLLPGLLWLMLHPCIQILVMNGTKDILFGVFLLHFAMDYLECIDADAAAPGAYIRLVASGIIMCLLRNQGKYIVLVLLVSCLLLRIRDKKFYLSLGIVLVACEAFFLTCTYGFHLEEGNKREMLSVPMQQMAYACYMAMDGAVDYTKVSEDDIMMVYELIPDWDVLINFNRWTADPVKEVFKTDVLTQNPGRYLKLYLRLGLKNPGLYYEEILFLMNPYFNMALGPATDLTLMWPFPQLNAFQITKKDLLPNYYAWLVEFAQKKRMTGVMSSAGMGLWLLVISTGTAIARKKKILFLGTLPILLFVFTMLLGPVALLRYLFPVTLGTPLLFGMLFFKYKA